MVNVTFAEDNAIPFFGPPVHQSSLTIATGGGAIAGAAADQPNFTGFQANGL